MGFQREFDPAIGDESLRVFAQPAQLLTTVDQGFGRYARWRIEIPENATAITLTLIFKITLLGHG